MNADSAGKTLELDTVLEALLKEQGFEHKMIEQKVFSAWERAVGKLIARNTQPVSLVKSKLTVHALSHPLVTELTFQRRNIIQKLNAEIGRAAVRELRFRMKPACSSLHEESQRTSGSQRHNMLEDRLDEAEVSADVLEKVEHTVEDVPDHELKSNLRRLFISQSRYAAIENLNR